jgi:hypothetical protein
VQAIGWMKNVRYDARLHDFYKINETHDSMVFLALVGPIHHHGKAIASIFQSVILEYQRTTSQHVRAVRTLAKIAHACTAFDFAMHMARAQATATDAKLKSESWQQSYAALRFSMTCRKFVANSP